MIALLSLTGPFDTYGAMPLGRRGLIYWTLVAMGRLFLRTLANGDIPVGRAYRGQVLKALGNRSLR